MYVHMHVTFFQKEFDVSLTFLHQYKAISSKFFPQPANIYLCL